MKVKELIEKLNGFDSELECFWKDVIEGDDCPLLSVYLDETGTLTKYDGKGCDPENIIYQEEPYQALFFSPEKE